MSDKKKSNVILFVVDSARYYSTGGKDDRDKLEMMDRFEHESIYFPVTVSAAPSSVMSLSSMLTSLSAYSIARNYDDFRYDNDQFDSLHKILGENGYDIRSIFNARELRFLFGDTLGQVPKKYWPKGTHGDQFTWSNEIMNIVLDNFLGSGDVNEPFFLIVWYNIRHDPETSRIVSEGLDLLKKHQVFDDSVFILTSDHGYMDPKRGYSPEKLVEMGLSHDLLLTDDNIRIPFYLKYPGSQVQCIDEPVSTVDFMPTILSLLGISHEVTRSSQINGMDLVPLIAGDEEAKQRFNERKVRCDARFFAQKDRSTALRNRDYKYIIRPDSDVEELYYLPDDKWEENNVLEDPAHQEALEDFRESYRSTENRVIEFQYHYLLKQLSVSLRAAQTGGAMNLAFLGLGEPYYLGKLMEVLGDYFPDDSRISYFIPHDKVDRLPSRGRGHQVHAYNLSRSFVLQEQFSRNESFDHLIVLVDSTKRSDLDEHIGHIAKVGTFLNVSILDPNMELQRSGGSTSGGSKILRRIKSKWKFYTRHPRIFLEDVVIFLKKDK